MIQFKELLDYCQAEAIANKVSPTEDSVWRSICHTYSKTFHTPLHMVLEMDPEHVVLNVYENQIEDVDDSKYENLEKMMDTVMMIENPEYEKEKEDQLSKDIEKYEREEEERVAKGEAIHPSLRNKFPSKKTLPKSEEIPAENKPTGGSANLSGLSEADES